jgi:hypothetical protein
LEAQKVEAFSAVKFVYTYEAKKVPGYVVKAAKAVSVNRSSANSNTVQRLKLVATLHCEAATEPSPAVVKPSGQREQIVDRMLIWRA